MPLYNDIANVANMFSHLTQNYTDALLASFSFIRAMADAADLSSTISQKDFVSFNEFLPDCIKDWYSPFDDEWLLTTLQQQLFAKWQQDEDSLLITNAQLQDLEDPLVDLKPTFKRSTRFARPFTDKEVESQKKNAILEKTRQDTEYCLYLFNQWRENLTETMEVSIPMLSEMDCSQLSWWCSNLSLKPGRKMAVHFNLLHCTTSLLV